LQKNGNPAKDKVQRPGAELGERTKYSQKKQEEKKRPLLYKKKADTCKKDQEIEVEKVCHAKGLGFKGKLRNQAQLHNRTKHPHKTRVSHQEATSRYCTAPRKAAKGRNENRIRVRGIKP